MSKTFDVQEAKEFRDQIARELASTAFVHVKGGRYLVADVAVEEATGDLTIVYVSVATGWRWSRPLHVFRERFKAVPL